MSSVNRVSEVSVGDSLIVLLGGLQLDQIHNVDDLELDAELVELVGSSHDLLSRNVASGGKHDLGFVVGLGGGSPLPLGSTLLELSASFVQGQPGSGRLLTSNDRVDHVGGLVALLSHSEQHVGIHREVDADHVIVVEALVQQDGGDTRILVGEAVVILTPHVEETSRFMEEIGLRHGISRTVASSHLACWFSMESITCTKDS